MVCGMANITEAGGAVVIDFGEGEVLIAAPISAINKIDLGEAGQSAGLPKAPAHWDYSEVGGMATWAVAREDVL